MKRNFTGIEKALFTVALVLLIYSGWLAYQLKHAQETKQAVIDMYNAQVEMRR